MGTTYVTDPKKVHSLNDGNGGVVFAVERPNGGFELTESVAVIRRGKGDAKKRKAQKTARKRQRK